MDTSRLIINTIDKSSYNVEESTSIVGFTVVEAPKGPIYPVRIPAGGSARIKDIFGVSSKEYPELFEVETFNREYDVYVSAPYGTGTKVNVAYITDDGIFPGYEPITYDKDLESVIMGFEDDSTVEGFASMMGIDGTVSVMKDYRYPKSSNMPGADSDLGGGYYPDYESTENGENVITASTGLTSLSGVEKLRLVIPPYSYDLTIDSNNILDKGTEIVGKIEESEGKKVLEFEGTLCGKAAGGTAYFSAEGENGENITDRIYIHSYEFDFDSCKEALTALYGAPVSEWEEPFVRVKGGAVSNAVFQKGNIQLHLSWGSEREFVELEFSFAKF